MKNLPTGRFFCAAGDLPAGRQGLAPVAEQVRYGVKTSHDIAISIGARRETRTLMISLSRDFESRVSTIPPSGQFLVRGESTIFTSLWLAIDPRHFEAFFRLKHKISIENCTTSVNGLYYQ